MVLELKDWRIRRGRDLAIGAMDFYLNAGEMVTVMGPSGVGKTTWLMSLLGYEETDVAISGNRIHGGKVLASGEIPKHSLYIPQVQPFNPNWEVQGFLLRLPWGNPSWFDLLFPVNRKRYERVREVLQQLGLAKRAKATVSELSGGETQRAAIAQILLLSPQLLIADEFVSGLDVGMATVILETCRQELVRTGGAAILASHDSQTALRVSDRLLIVFPPYVDIHPWELKRGEPAWNGNLVNTLLCFARLAKDTPPREGICHLARYIHTWIKDESALAQFREKFTEESVILLTDSGELKPIHFDGNSSLPEWQQTSLQEGMIHTKVFIQGQWYIGVILPATSESKSLMIIA
jgi:ABC-type multidrug transport system ATPase subunit